MTTVAGLAAMGCNLILGLNDFRDECFEVSQGKPCPDAGAGGSSEATASTGGGGTSGCNPNETRGCWDGPDLARSVGICADGIQTCQDDATWGKCEGEVLPKAETCASTRDEDCNKLDCVEWASEFGDPVNVQTVTGIADDAATGDTIVLFSFGGTLRVGATTLETPSGNQAAAAASIKADGSPRWLKQIGTGALTVATVDTHSGDIYIGGESPAFTFESTSVPKGEFVLSLDKAGHLRWAKPLGNAPSGPANSLLAPTGLSIIDGDVYVAGQYSLPIDFGDGPINPVAGTASGYVARIRGSDGHGSSASSGAYWTSTFGNVVPSSVQPKVVTTPFGSALVAATISASTSLGGQSFAAAGGHDILIAFVGPNVTTGYVLGDQLDQDVSALAMSPFGTFCIGGTMKGTMSVGTHQVAAPGAEGQAFLVQIESSSYRWGTALGAPGMVTGLGFDPMGRVRLAGWFKGDAKLADKVVSAPGGAVFLGDIDSDGTWLWERHYSATVESFPFLSIAANEDGTSVLGGTALGQIDFGTGTLGSKLDHGQAYLVKFAP